MYAGCGGVTMNKRLKDEFPKIENATSEEWNEAGKFQDENFSILDWFFDDWSRLKNFILRLIIRALL
jgi:hypothetical protein